MFSLSAAERAEHIVQKGETLYSISRSYGFSLDEIRKVNNLENSSVVKAGQKLYLPETDTVVSPSPKPAAYTVQKGDTLYSIAKANDLTVDKLQELNALTPGGTLQAGQILALTAAAAKQAVAPASPAAPKAAAPEAASIRTPAALGGISATLKPAEPKPAVSQPAPAQKPVAAPSVTVSSKTNTTVKWPVQKPSVTYINGKITGVQLTAEENETVTAINNGIVIYSGPYRGFGNVVFVQSASGYMYVYTELGKIHVNAGSQIASGDVLGTAGLDTASGKSQLTFMVYQNGKPIDPAAAPRG